MAEVIMLARFKSRLPMEEITTVMKERMPEFRALDGLEQKYYLHDPESGEVAGLYLWRSEEALGEFAQSELRASIAEAYEAEAPPRVEIYRVLEPLRP